MILETSILLYTWDTSAGWAEYPTTWEYSGYGSSEYILPTLEDNHHLKIKKEI